ncbi:AzlD domain-containing protein [Streptomyces sp. LN245]|uniref:AzlD domain-containing protein n=1 Tax=Streptomyces sp. LN245 TaxID=3112975 RepID=UPI00371C9D45
MNSAWTIVLAVGVVSVLLKAAGPVLLGGRALPNWLQRMVALMAPTLLAALIATQIFADGRQLSFDARAAGLAVGAVGVWRDWPVLLVVALGAAATALTRLALR